MNLEGENKKCSLVKKKFNGTYIEVENFLEFEIDLNEECVNNEENLFIENNELVLGQQLGKSSFLIYLQFKNQVIN